MTKPTSKNTLKHRSTWVAAMVACFIFLLMAVKVYEVPAATMTTKSSYRNIRLGGDNGYCRYYWAVDVIATQAQKISVGPTLFLWSLSGHDRC